MTSTLTKAEQAEVASNADRPRVEPKWTIRNGEWIEVMFAIHRGPGGLSDRPFTSTINAGAGKP